MQRLLCDLLLGKECWHDATSFEFRQNIPPYSKRKLRHLDSADREYVQLKSLDIIGPYPGSQFAIHNLPHSHTLLAKKWHPKVDQSILPSKS